jgi:hypothetical protein
MKTYMQIPENWKSVAVDGNPEEGLYLALYKADDNNLVVELLTYYPDDGSGHLSGAGWLKEDTYDAWGDSDGDIQCDVVAYLPESICMHGLRSVRARFLA